MADGHAIYSEIRRQRSETPCNDPWGSENWWQAFVYIFYYGPRQEAHPDVDNLLFLVLSHELRTSVSQKTPYMVLRREGDVLPAEFVVGGERFGDINWQETLELNLALQSSYMLTVAVCSVDEIPFLSDPDFSLDRNTIVVSKHVHASTLSGGVNITHKKTNQTSVCYPDVCFAVEDFEESFSGLIMSEVPQRFCVLLSVLESSTTDTKTKQDNRIFGGFVSFNQVKKELFGRQNWFNRVANEQVIEMTGPDGKGAAEVSTSIDAESPEGPSSDSDEDGKATFKSQQSNFFRKSVQSAKDLLKKIQGEEDGSALTLTSKTKLKFCCSLMSLTLPVSLVASKILESDSYS